MSQTDEEETSEIESFILDQESFSSDRSVLASRFALLAATAGQSSLSEGSCDDQISVDAETQARLEALLEAAGIGKLSTADGKAFADPEVLRRLSSSVSCALDEAAAALSKMKTENESTSESAHERTLVEACTEGDVNTVKRLLCEGRSANETTEDGESLLSLACSAGYYELAEVLLCVPPYTDERSYLTSENSLKLRHKINPTFLATLNQQLTKVLLAMHANVEDCGAKGDCTPLMEAASGGYADIVRLLLSHGADVNATSSTGNTALTYACCGGYEDVVRLLVDAGAELECHNENGHTPLMEAASGGHVGVAAILLDRGAGINTHSNEFKESALTLACYKGHLDMVKFLLQAGADQEHKTDEMHTALMEASMDGHVEVARLLLDSGAQVNMPADSFESPLTLAACGGHVELAELLIQRGAALEEVNDEGYTPLMEAAREGHEEMVALLLAKNANVNAKTEETQETALTLACCGGFLECAELLVKAGADLETGCSTPLMEAAQEGQLELVKFLLQQGANVHATTASGDTALSYACEHGHTDVADVLLAAGAVLEHETEGGRTPLMKAARAGHLCTVQFLISRGADVNRTTKNNEHSVLSLACVCGHLSVVELLLCQGADPTQKLKDGSTMLLESSKGGHTSVVKLLLDFPKTYGSLPPENSQAGSPAPEQATPRVPTQSLPMVVPPQEPDQAPQLPLTADGDYYPDVGEHLAPIADLRRDDVKDKNAFACGVETAATLVSQLIQQGNILSQASDYIQPDTKLAVDKDVAVTVESFLRSMACDAAVGKARSAESIVEEAQGKLTELEQRIKEAIEKNAQLKSIEMMQTDQLTKEKVEELYKTREEQIHKKQKILEELQKVERELQLKTQQQLKKHYLDMKQGESSTSSQRGKPDGEDTRTAVSSESDSFQSELYVQDKETPKVVQAQSTAAVEVPSSAVARANSPELPQPNQKLNNGSSGALPQAAKDVGESYCQCVHHPCPQLSHPASAETESYERPASPIDSEPQQQNKPVHPNLDVNGFTESNHDTPLTLACAGGHEDLVRLLIKRGASIEHRDKKGFTPLILAATAGHVGVVSILLQSKADIEAQSERTKDTPLSLACSGGRLEVVELLLESGANKEHRNVSDYTPLSLAASGGYVSIIKLLLSHGAEINSRTGSKLGISPLMLAAMNGHTQAVQLLLDMGADINAQIETNRNTALTLACFQGRHEVVSLLVDRRANVEHRAKTGLTPLMEAASGGYAEVGRVLLDKGADPNAPPVPSSRDTALTIAADKGHYRFCELVLSRGAQVEVKNKKGNTPLWLACNGGHLDVVKLLVVKGADVNAADNRNVIPLMAAFRKGHVQVVHWLAKEVSQFPSDAECMRYIATITDRDLLKRCHQCMECIAKAKDRQAQEANKCASELLEALDFEKNQEQNRKERQARKREKRRLKRKQKSTKKTDDDANKDEKDIEIEAEHSNDLEHVEKPEMKAVLKATELLTISGPPIATTTYTATTSAVNRDSKPATVPRSTVAIPTEPERLAAPKQRPPSASAVTVVTSTPRGEEKKKKPALQAHKETGANNSTSGSDSSPRSSSRKNRKVASSQRASQAGARADVATAKQPARATSGGGHRNSAAVAPSPNKRTQRRDEGWKEVTTRKFTNSNSAKRIMVSPNLISRVIGRGGSNINAIREVTGAHIDIDKQRKGGQDRTVTIKGAAEAIKHAYNLITALIKEDRSDQEISAIISKVQAAQSAMHKQQQQQQKPTMTVVAAPIPTKPAWTVPPSIVAQASSQPRPQPTVSSAKVGAWGTAAVASIASSTASTVPNKWSIPVATATVVTSGHPASVETVKKALFVAPPQSPTTSATTCGVVSSSLKPPGDKPISKPVQPVAPMVSTKVPSTAQPRPSPSASHGSAASHQRPASVHQPLAAAPCQVTVTVSPTSLQEKQSSMQPIASSMGPAALSLAQPGPTPAMMMSSPVVQTQAACSSNPSTPGPVGTDPGACAATPDRRMPQNFASESDKVIAAGRSSTFGSIMKETPTHSTPTYSPFNNSFVPTAGSATLWNNDPAAASPYHSQAPVNGFEQSSADAMANSVDQSKAPGYRGNMKSPANDNAIGGGVSVPASVSGKSLEGISPVASQQGSPKSGVSDTDAPVKPRPIGTERAHHRRVNPQLPLTTAIGQRQDGIWSYDSLPPAQIGVEALDQNKYSNWSAVMATGTMKDGTVTTSTTNKPQVTPSEVESLKAANMEQQNPQMNALNRAFIAVPPVGFGSSPGRLPPSSRFLQTTLPTARVGTQPPIGSHLGGGSNVGVVGAQQQSSPQQPIGAHLGSGGHLRSSNSFQPMQRNFAANQMPARYQMPPYSMNADMSRYMQSMGSDMSWQQQQQQSLYHQRQLHNPYQQKELANNSGLYNSVPSQFSSSQDGGVGQQQQGGMQGYPNHHVPDMNHMFPLQPDNRAPMIGDSMPYFDASNEYMVRCAMPNNFAGPGQAAPGAAAWEMTGAGQPGFAAMNGGDNRSLISQNGMDGDGQAMKNRNQC